jgi:mediator of RNA polymerase II transcription subunit 14
MKSTQVNGNFPNALGMPNPQDQEINKQKKILLLRFAMDNRAKFIKLLVLTEWGKKASVDVSKLIDLFAWTNQQSWAQNQIDDKIEQIKLAMNQARQLNPDIRTALEILGTGKAEWIPDVSVSHLSLDSVLMIYRWGSSHLLQCLPRGRSNCCDT